VPRRRFSEPTFFGYFQEAFVVGTGDDGLRARTTGFGWNEDEEPEKIGVSKVELRTDEN